MSGIFELLNFRRAKGIPTNIQISWCAATKKNFVSLDDTYKVTPKEVESVDLCQLCSDIRGLLFQPEFKVCFKLTVGAQLTYGILRIFSHQTCTLEQNVEAVFSTISDYDVVNQRKGKAKKNPKLAENESPIDEKVSTIEDFSDVDVHELFRGDSKLTDDNLIEEIDQFLQTETSSVQLSPATSDVEKVMQELYEEMHRMDRGRGKRDKSKNQETNHSETLREDIMRTPRRTPQRFPPKSAVKSSSSESASTARTPPSSQMSVHPLQTSVLGGIPTSQNMEHELDTPMIESEILPEAEMSNIPPLSQSSIVASAYPVAPLLPEVNVTLDNSESRDPLRNEENFPVIHEDDGEISVGSNIAHENLLIEIVEVKADVHTRKKTRVDIIKKIARKKVPVQTLFKCPTTSCIIGLKKSNWSKTLIDRFTNIFESRERELKASAAAHELAVKASAAAEEPSVTKETNIFIEKEMEHSPPKIMKINENTSIQEPVRDNEVEMQRDSAIPENNQMDWEVQPHDYLDPQNNDLGQKQMDNVESLSVEDNICKDTDVPNRRRRRSSSSSDVVQIKGPKSKKIKLNETDEDAQSETVINKDGVFSTTESLWRFIKMKWQRKSNNGPKKVDFEEIVHPDRCNAYDVITTMLHCFVLEKDGKVSIKQEKPYGPLYLVNPSR